MSVFSGSPYNLDQFPDKIRMLFSFPSYRRGLDYYYDGAVNELSFNKNQNIWVAEVEGTELYTVIIQFNEEGIGYRCSCAANAKYGECKHTVAALLQIHKTLTEDPDIQKFPFLKLPLFGGVPNYASQLIDLFANETELDDRPVEIFQKSPLNVEYILKAESNGWGSPILFKVELKVGPERAFVVKNIHQFLRHIKTKMPLPFTKNFTYDPSQYIFDESDQTILELFQQITESEQFFSYTSLGTEELSARSLKIPPGFIDHVLDLLNNKVSSFVTDDGKSYPNYQLNSGPLPLNFQLMKNEESYELNTESFKTYTYLPEYHYLIKENDLYKLSEPQRKTYEKLSQLLKNPRFEHLVIPPEDMEPFLAHVVPSLKQIGQLTLDPEISTVILSPKLTTKLFLDQDDDRLTAKLEYHYGEHILSPFEEQEELPQDRLLLRDIEKEKAILPFLKEAHFKEENGLLYLDDEDDLFNFLYNLLPFMEKEAEIYMTSDVETMLFTRSAPPKIKVELEPNENWLDISFDLDGIAEEEIQHLLQSVVEKKNYVRLPSGAFIPLQNEDYKPISKLFEELQLDPDDYKGGRLNVPAFRGFQIDEVLEESKHRKFNKAFKELIEAIKDPEDLDVPLPTKLQAKLRDYQKTGYQWFHSLSKYHFGGILADDMGLGKTLQTISYLLSQKEASSEPALVVSPASLIYNWKSECEKFAPNLKVLVINGTKAERQSLLETAVNQELDLLITSYPLLRQDIEAYKELRFSTLILDEAQAIKNQATQTAKAVKSIQALHRFALSGTPIENSLDELWSIFEAVMPGFFPNKRIFNGLEQEKISRMTRPFILRRLKKDVLKELPDKIESVQTSELTADQKKLYLGYLERIQGETASVLATEGFQKSRMKILAGLTRLRQLCCHPSLFIDNYEGESGKLNQLLELVETAKANGQRLLIFSQFSSMLKLIQNELKRIEIEPFYLDGETPSKERVEMAERFNQGERDLFLISLKAGGTGLNLTGADTVVLFDLWWNPAIEEQAAGRAHRIGQKKVVQVIRLIAEGTIEEKIYELQQKKKELIDSVIQPGETMLSSLSESDIRDLLNM